jgi:multidrug efflux system membrane fusion protein
MAVPPSQDPSVPQPGTIMDAGHLLPEHASEDNAPRSRGWRKWIALLVVLLIAVIIVWRVHESHLADQVAAQKAAAAANRPIPVQVYTVQSKSVPVFLSALGTVTAYNTVTLQARVDGQLLAVNFVEGQNVHKGQLLVQIDPRPYQAALDQAIGTLAKDEANLKNMQAEAERYSALYAAGVVSKEQEQLQVSNSGQAQGSIKADQAAIEAARVNLGYTKIYSPIEGVVGLRQVDPGNIVTSASPATGLVVITQIHPIAVVFTLPEDQIPLVQQAIKGGSKLVVEAYDRSDSHKIGAGTLLTIDNQIDTTTGTAKLKAIFDNKDNNLFANQFVNVRLILKQRANATLIPTAAIQSGTQGDYVFVVNPGPTPANKRQNQPNGGSDGGKSKHGGAAVAGTTAGTGSKSSGKTDAPFHADQVPVHVDFVIGTMSILSDGILKNGQKVVIDGQEKLVDGGNVAIAQPTAKPNTAASGSDTSAAPSSNSSGGITQGTSPPVPPSGTSSHNQSGPGSIVSGDTSGSANSSGSNGGSNQ